MSNFKPPRVDPKKQYVLKRTDKVEFVAQLTPMLDSPEIGNARRFDGKWLNDNTCWRWWTFHEPIEVTEAIKLYRRVPEQMNTQRVISVTKRTLGRKGQKTVGISALKPKPKRKKHAPIRRVLKKTVKRRRLH